MCENITYIIMNNNLNHYDIFVINNYIRLFIRVLKYEIYLHYLQKSFTIT